MALSVSLNAKKRKPDVHHHPEADYLRAGFEVAKWAAFCHFPKLKGCPARLNQFCSDEAHARGFRGEF